MIKKTACTENKKLYILFMFLNSDYISVKKVIQNLRIIKVWFYHKSIILKDKHF